jgi:3,4-dihydroxy 2-butanone 4-phosphate synthase/GTP cyclohydrolase II
MTTPDFAPVDAAFAALSAGDLIVLVDDDSEAATGALAGAAQFMTTEQLVWLSRRVTGLIGIPMTTERADELHLTLMVPEDEATGRGAFTVSVDLVEGNTTGSSPADQARTIAALARAEVNADDFARPGHVFPLRAREGGVLKRAGHAEAVVDLCRLAGLSPVGVVADLVGDGGDMMPLADASAFAAEHDLLLVSIADVVRHRRKSEILVEQMGVARVPTKHGDFMCHAYRSVLDGVDHIAFVMGDVDGGDPPLVRVHSECLTGDILGSLRCDCGPQLDLALKMIAEEGRGAVVYLRGHEGRGIGIGHKMRAYALQDEGLDTVEANSAQGLPVDSREYGVGANILSDLGVTRFRIMTNNPAKLTGLDGYGLEIVDRVPVEIASNPENEKYLETKRTRMGHTLSEGASDDA